MCNFILAINSLICLILSPAFFLLGVASLFEKPVSGLLLAFVVAPLMIGLAIVFDHMREQLDRVVGVGVSGVGVSDTHCMRLCESLILQ